MTDPVFPLLRALDTFSPDLSAQLERAGQLAGRPGDTPAPAGARAGGSARHEWLLRWLLDKLAAAAAARESPAAWALLDALIRSVPLQSAAKVLRAKDLCGLLERSMLECVERCVRHTDAEGDSAMDVDDDDHSTPNRSTPPTPRSEAVQLMSGIAAVARTVAVSVSDRGIAARSNSISVEHLRSVRQCGPYQAGRIVGAWLRLVGLVGRGEWCNSTSAILHFWTKRVSRPEEEKEAQLLAFSNNVLVPAASLLSRGADTPLLVADAEELKALIVRNVLLPAHRDYMAANEGRDLATFSTEAPRDSELLGRLLAPLGEYYNDQESEGGQDPNLAVYIFRLAVDARPEATPATRQLVDGWIEVVCAGLLHSVHLLPSDASTPSKAATEAVKGIVWVLTEASASVRVPSRFLVKIFDCLVKERTLSGSNTDLVVAFMGCAPDIFFPTTLDARKLCSFALAQVADSQLYDPVEANRLYDAVVRPWIAAALRGCRLVDLVSAVSSLPGPDLERLMMGRRVLRRRLAAQLSASAEVDRHSFLTVLRHFVAVLHEDRGGDANWDDGKLRQALLAIELLLRGAKARDLSREVADAALAVLRVVQGPDLVAEWVPRCRAAAAAVKMLEAFLDGSEFVEALSGMLSTAKRYPGSLLSNQPGGLSNYSVSEIIQLYFVLAASLGRVDPGGNLAAEMSARLSAFMEPLWFGSPSEMDEMIVNETSVGIFEEDDALITLQRHSPAIIPRVINLLCAAGATLTNSGAFSPFVSRATSHLPEPIRTILFQTLADDGSGGGSPVPFPVVAAAVAAVLPKAIPRPSREAILDRAMSEIEAGGAILEHFTTMLRLLAAPCTTSSLFSGERLRLGAVAAAVDRLAEPDRSTAAAWLGPISQAVFAQVPSLSEPDQLRFGQAVETETDSLASLVKKRLRKPDARRAAPGSLLLAREIGLYAAQLAESGRPATLVDPLARADRALRRAARKTGSGNFLDETAAALAATLAHGGGAAPAPIRGEQSAGELAAIVAGSLPSARARASCLSQVRAHLQRLPTSSLVVILTHSLGAAAAEPATADTAHAHLTVAVLAIPLLATAINNSASAARDVPELERLRDCFTVLCGRLSLLPSMPAEPARRLHGQLSALLVSVFGSACGWLITQPAVDRLLSALTQLSRPRFLASLAGRPEGEPKEGADRTAAAVFDQVVQLSRMLLQLHRPRLTGRFQLVVPLLENLVACLFYRPLVHHPSGPGGAQLAGLEARALSRLLVAFASPPSSAGQHAPAHAHGGQVLVDSAGRARKHAGRYAQYVLMQYCRCALGSPPALAAAVGPVAEARAGPSPFQPLLAEVRLELMPGVLGLVGLLEPGIRAAMTEEMDGQARAVWAGLLEEWEREHKR